MEIGIRELHVGERLLRVSGYNLEKENFHTYSFLQYRVEWRKKEGLHEEFCTERHRYQEMVGAGI